MDNNELMHYGVLGMKWGKRKARRTPSEDHLKVKQIRKKRISEMSNQDLKDANARLELENKYRTFSKNANAGQRALRTFIGTAGTITAAMAAYGTYKKLGGKALDKIGDWVLKDLNRGLKL